MRGKSILLVEDEDGIALALRILLEREGHEVRRAATGPDALAAVRECAPDLVLLDVLLPGCSGHEVCERIRQDPALSEIRIVMMSARSGEMDRRKGLALGADAFVSKPFATADLTATVRRLLDERVN
jgi:DNA-binding response OmpR family regulator